MTRTKRIIHIAILASLASAISILDRYLSLALFPFIPGAKIGLANIIVLVALMNFDFKECLLIVFLKALIGNLIPFGLTSFIIGGTASLVSFLVMYVIKRHLAKYVSYVGIGTTGAFFHTIVQVMIIIVMYKMSAEVFVYGYFYYLLLIALISGVLLSIISIRVNKLYTHIYNKKEDEKVE